MSDAPRKPLLHQELSSQIISAFYEVYNTMVRGLLEGCYQNALYVELQERGIPVDREVPFGVRYKERIVGQYCVDLLVDRKVIVECKTADTLHSQHEAQMLHYLRATNTELGLLMYFGSKPLFRRFVHTNGSAASFTGIEEEAAVTDSAETEDPTPAPPESTRQTASSRPVSRC